MNTAKKISLSIILLLSLSVVSPEINSQCPMCRMSAESNLQEGGSAGKGLNKGIFVLLLTPYLVVGAIGYTWYRNKNKNKSESE